MPVQKFAPMSKDYPTFDCDAHVTEPTVIWERAKDLLTADELAALKATDWYDPETKQYFINGKTGGHLLGLRGNPRFLPFVSLSGPGIKHDVQRTLNVRNLRAETALTKEQSDYLDHPGSYEPKPRLRDMDIQGIDQVMIIPTDIDTYPWLQNALGARAMCKAYNEWAYEYTLENPERLFFAALIPMQDAKFAVEELYRVAAKGCRVGLIRPTDAMGNYPVQPKYEACGMRWKKPGSFMGCTRSRRLARMCRRGTREQYSSAELIQRTISTSGIPHTFLGNMQAFMAEASVWVTATLMSGFFERHPKIKAAVFESDSTWLSFVLDECDKAFKLYRSPPTAGAQASAQRDLLRALLLRLRGRRVPSLPSAGFLPRHLRVVIRRLPS